MQQHKKFALIGAPGSGKSTFAAKLGKLLSIPVHHLDRHMFVAGGKKRDREEFLAIQKTMIQEAAWIIEGCSMSTLEMRFAEADTLLYFQIPRLICIFRVFKRLFSYDKTLNDTPDGCSKVVSFEILKYIWNFDRERRAQIEELRKKYPHVDFRLIKSSQDADNYLQKISAAPN